LTVKSTIKTIAIIPARGGSKGVPRKNLYPIAGQPLIGYTIKAAVESKEFDSVLITSDDEEILKYAKSVGASTLRRPGFLAEDVSPTDPVIQHCITEMSLEESVTVCLLQPTSPLRQCNHINEALQLYKSNDCKAVIGVTEPDKTPYKAYRLDEDGFMTGLGGAEYPYMPRQNLPQTYYPNGAIYIFSVNSFHHGDCIPRDKLLPYVMSWESSVDIDVLSDIELVERILS